jgi:hypothetical protein
MAQRQSRKTKLILKNTATKTSSSHLDKIKRPTNNPFNYCPNNEADYIITAGQMQEKNLKI